MTSDSERLRTLDKQHLWHPFTPQQRWNTGTPLVIERARGAQLIDTDGRTYIDGVSSLWTNVHGHGHPRIDEAVRQQLDRLAHSTMLGLTHPEAIHLATELVNIAPEGLTRVFYSDSGSTATEIAIKMAYQAQQQRGQTQRTRFMTLQDAYHGDTLGAVSVGGIKTFHELFRPLLFDAIIAPAPLSAGGDEEEQALNTALQLIYRHGEELAGIIVEPLVQGAAGMKMHSWRFIQRLVDAAREVGALVVADEVAVGFGRTGSMFAMEQVGRAPDLLCLAKGISGGYLPLAATLASEAVYDAFLGAPTENRQFFHGHTYTGNPLACAAARASLRVFNEERTLEHARRLSVHLASTLDSLLGELKWVTAVRQCGVMVGIDIAHPDGPAPPDCGHRIAMACRNHGAIIRPLGNTVVLNPPLSLTLEEAERLVSAVRSAILEVMNPV